MRSCCAALCYGGPKAIRYAKFYSRLRDAVICVYEVPCEVVETYEQAAEFWRAMNGTPAIFVLDTWTCSYVISSCYGDEKLRVRYDTLP